MAAKKNEVCTTTKPWKYEDAVSTGRELVKLHGKITLDLVRELHSAREVLSNPGARTDLTSRQNVARCNDSKFVDQIQNERQLSPWEKYCLDIGISKRTAERHLQLYDHENDRILTQEELKAKIIMEFESLIKQLDPAYPDWRPDGWNNACERYYQSKKHEGHLLKIAERDHFEQLDLFNEAFLSTITAPIATPEDILHFSEIKKRIAPIAYPGAPVNRQAHAVMIVEKVLKDFPSKDRRGVAKALAEATLLIAADEE